VGWIEKEGGKRNGGDDDDGGSIKFMERMGRELWREKKKKM
jgi:hypothetical protein